MLSLKAEYKKNIFFLSFIKFGEYTFDVTASL